MLFIPEEENITDNKGDVILFAGGFLLSAFFLFLIRGATIYSK